MKLDRSDWEDAVIHIYGYKIFQVHLCMTFLCCKHPDSVLNRTSEVIAPLWVVFVVFGVNMSFYLEFPRAQ